MDNIILKTALRTLLVLLIALLAAFAVMSLGFPQIMASTCEKLGNYGLALNYASLRYTYTGDSADLDRCARDSILAESDENIKYYCQLLVDDEKADELLEDEDYRQYVYSNLARVYYQSDEWDKAFEIAERSIEGRGFPKNNAAATLSVLVAESGDASQANELLNLINGVSGEIEDEQYFNRVKNILNDKIQKGAV